MDLKFEHIVPWNGKNDTGRDARLKLQRNFEKIAAVLKDELGDDSLSKKFLRKDIEDVTRFLLTMLAGAAFGVYRKGISGANIDKDGNVEAGRAELRDRVVSTDFNAGPLGTGFLMRTDPKTGRSYIEVDELFVRIKAIFTELEIRKLSYAGGNWIFSAAGGKCAKVEELPDVYRCYIKVSDGETIVENEFRVGDQVRCQEFKIKPGVHQNVASRYYWRLVTAVGEDYIDLSKTDCDASSDAPKAGDAMVQLGHRTNPQRQNAIVISAYGEGSPSFTQHTAIDSYSLAGTEKTRISPTKNVFTGKFIFESGKEVEEAISTQGTQIQQIIKDAASTQASAEAAKQSAEKANTMLAELADDNKLAATEKQDVKKEWDIIMSEKPKNDAAADKFGVSKTQYGTAYNALNAYITPLLANLSVTSGITGSEFRAKFKAYYDARTDLLNAITAKAKKLADDAQASANNANAKAEQARQNAAAAQASANEANVLLADIANDNKLSPVEKQQTKKEWDVIVSEKPKNDTLADKYGISKLAYNTAYNALNTYVTPLLVDLGATSNITGSEFRAKFKAYYDARTELLNDISAKAKQLADDAQASANNAVGQIVTVKTEMKALDDKIALKVDSTTFNSLNQKVTQQGSELQLAKDAIASKVSVASFNEEMEKKNILAACNDSNMISDDPSFRRGMNGITVYNNAYSGAVTITRMSGCPVNSSGYYLDMRTSATGKVEPGYGGFTFNYPTSARKRLVVIFSAWLDVGRYFTFATNATGDKSRQFWLTDNKGKGTWATYAFYVECGSDGQFSTTFFFYVGGGGRPVITYISYAAIHQLDADQDFKARMSSAESSITQHADMIATKVSKTEFDKLGNRVSTAETSITQLSNSIKLKADQTVVDGINNRLNSAEIALNPDKIWLKVSEKVNKVAGDASNKTKEEIKAGIGVTTNGITILGKTISLSGVVTFSSLDANAQSKINNAQNTANAANTAASNAQNTANTANAAASNAQNAAKQAYDKAVAAYGKKVGLSDLDTTIIEGGNILTNSIVVKQINAVTGNIGAFVINDKGLVNDDKTPQAYISVGQDMMNHVYLNKPGADAMLSVRADSVFDTAIRIFNGSSVGKGLDVQTAYGGIAIESAGSHFFRQRDGDKWAAPGVLWAGRIRQSNGSLISSWGDGIPGGVSITKLGTGSFKITHRLSSTEYYVVATAEGDGNNWPSAYVGKINYDSFEVYISDKKGDTYGSCLYVCIIGSYA